MPVNPARVVVVGLGPIGVEVARAVRAREGMTLVGAADPVHAGKDFGQLLGGEPIGVAIAASAKEAYERSGGNMAVLCTGSRTEIIATQIEEALASGYAVVSTCEELAFPRHTAPQWANKVDARARELGVAVLGTGVNPGFVMDRLPLALAAVCVRVERIFVKRVVDAAKRRGPLRQKVGAGFSVAEFEAGVHAGRLGHVGLAESVALLAHGLGWTLESVEQNIKPVVATAENVRAGIEPGRVAGIHQMAWGRVRGSERLRLDLEMSVAAPDPHDRVQIEGDPPVDTKILGGVQGDRATVGTVLSAIPALLAGPPGLRTVADLPAGGLLL